MVEIPVVSREIMEIDETGNSVIKTINEPETQFPPNAVKVICSGAVYTVYEQGDVIP